MKGVHLGLTSRLQDSKGSMYSLEFSKAPLGFPRRSLWHPLWSSNYICLLMVVDGHHWFLMVVDGFHWFLMVVNAYYWFLIVVDGY